MPARPGRLDDAEIAARLSDLGGWKLDEGKLYKQFGFPDFNAAFGWMTRVALVAETLNHHPEWQNVYNRVSVHLTTHDVGGLSALDFTMANRMDELANQPPAPPSS